MAEYRKRGFSHFARDFFLYSTYFPLYLNERDSFNPKVFILHTKSAVFEISSGFNPFMREYVFNNTKDVVLKTDEDLFRFLVPRCLKISFPFFHQSLIVAMSFIHEFLLFLQMNRLCYRFHFTAYKCLLSVFRREYEKDWDMMDGWEGFQKEVKEAIKFIRPHETEGIRMDGISERMKFYDEVKHLLKNCNADDDGEEFVLSEYDLELIAEDNTQYLEEDSDKVDEDPIQINLKPTRDEMREKSKDFYEDKDYFEVPISALIAVPPYYKPEIDYFPSNDQSDLETESSSSSQSDSSSFESDSLPTDKERYLKTYCSDSDSMSYKPEVGSLLSFEEKNLVNDSFGSGSIPSPKVESLPSDDENNQKTNCCYYQSVSSKPGDVSLPSSDKENDLKTDSSDCDSISQKPEAGSILSFEERDLVNESFDTGSISSPKDESLSFEEVKNLDTTCSDSGSSKPEDGSLPSSDKEKDPKTDSSDSDSISYTPEVSSSSSDEESNLCTDCSDSGSIYAESYPDIEVDYDYCEDYESEFETRLFSDFEIYTSVMLSEALARHGAEKFHEKMMQRKCENCGIQCYQFSYNLFKKQLHSAVVRSEVI